LGALAALAAAAIIATALALALLRARQQTEPLGAALMVSVALTTLPSTAVITALFGGAVRFARTRIASPINPIRSTKVRGLDVTPRGLETGGNPKLQADQYN